MTLPFDIIIKPTSEQMKKIPHYDHIKDIKEVAKRMMFNNYADKNRKVRCYIAQDEEFIYISKNKHFQYLSKCIKSDNVKYCMKFFGDTFEALSNEEIETRNKTYEARINNELDEIEKAGGLDITTHTLIYDPETEKLHEQKQ